MRVCGPSLAKANGAILHAWMSKCSGRRLSASKLLLFLHVKELVHSVCSFCNEHVWRTMSTFVPVLLRLSVSCVTDFKEARPC